MCILCAYGCLTEIYFVFLRTSYIGGKPILVLTHNLCFHREQTQDVDSPYPIKGTLKIP